MIATRLPHAFQSGWHLLKRLATEAPRPPRLTLGLDVGSSSVKALALGPQRGSGSRPILGLQQVELNESETDANISEAIRQAVSALHCPARPVVFSVSGQGAILRVVEMTALKPEELAQALPFEAERHLPFSIQEVVLDGAILGPAEEHKVWVLLAACKREIVDQRLRWVQAADLEAAVIDVDALALGNALVEASNGDLKTGTQALINVGAQWTNLVVLKDGASYLARDIPWGGVKLLRQLAEQLGREGVAVQALLAQQGSSEPPELATAMAAACETLAAELRLSFDFFESRFGASPERLMVSGGLSQARGFLEALKGHLAQPLAVWTPRPQLPPQFAVAYGLALRSV